MGQGNGMQNAPVGASHSPHTHAHLTSHRCLGFSRSTPALHLFRGPPTYHTDCTPCWRCFTPRLFQSLADDDAFARASGSWSAGSRNGRKRLGGWNASVWRRDRVWIGREGGWSLAAFQIGLTLPPRRGCLLISGYY